jgi:hypothetical protein
MGLNLLLLSFDDVAEVSLPPAATASARSRDPRIKMLLNVPTAFDGDNSDIGSREFIFISSSVISYYVPTIRLFYYPLINIEARREV